MKRLTQMLALMAIVALSAPVAVQARTMSSAGSFMARIYLEQEQGGHGLHLYATLHPAQRRLIPMALWLACNPESPPSPGSSYIAPESLGELSHRNVSRIVPGTHLRVTAVEVRYRDTAFTGADLGIMTLHAVRVGGGWRWMLRASH